LRHKTIWITVASAGIGEVLAYDMAHWGGALSCRQEREAELERVADAAKAAGARDVLIVPFDITDEEKLPERMVLILKRIWPNLLF